MGVMFICFFMGAMESSNQRNSLFFSTIDLSGRKPFFSRFRIAEKLLAAAGNISEIFLPII
jgi:hypothetical protein